MDKKNNKLFFVASFEDASIIRKFTILFLLASIVPMALLYYIFHIYRTQGSLEMPITNLTAAMVLVVLGVFIGYKSMRALLMTVINITQENRKAIEHLLSKETIEELNKGENEIVVLSRSFSAVTKQLEENIKSLESAKKTLQNVMAKVGQGISNMQKIDTFLELIVETMTNALGGNVSTLLILNDDKTELTVKTVFGAALVEGDPQKIKLQNAAGLAKLLQEKKASVVSGVFLQNTGNQSSLRLFGETLLCAPLLYKDKVKGLITVSRNDGSPFSDDDLHLTFNLACQTAVALENSKLNLDIEKTYFETISALALAVDAKDKYSRGHLDRVAQYVTLIGKRLGLDETDLNTLRDAARLHDLGKLGIPDDVLRKEGPLTDDEWVIMRRHPEIGESIIKPVRSLNHLCDLVRHHHEKIDGTGYPDRLKGEEISPLVRILAVADVYDALMTERPYRARKSFREVCKILRSMKEHLDQDIVEVLLENINDQPRSV